MWGEWDSSQVGWCIGCCAGDSTQNADHDKGRRTKHRAQRQQNTGRETEGVRQDRKQRYVANTAYWALHSTHSTKHGNPCSTARYQTFHPINAPASTKEGPHKCVYPNRVHDISYKPKKKKKGKRKKENREKGARTRSICPVALTSLLSTPQTPRGSTVTELQQ